MTSIQPNQINAELAHTRYLAYAPTGYAPFHTRAEAEWKATIRADLEGVRPLWGGLITYGSTGPLALIPEIAKELGFTRVILGVYDLSDEAEIATALELVRVYPELIRSVCLGNEGLLFGRYSVPRLESVFRRFREAAPGVWLTTSEPIFSWGEQRLIEAVDYCAPILHPWIHEIFAGRPVIAATWVIQAAQRLQLLSEKPVLIKETGYPADGERYAEADQCLFWETLLAECGAFTRNVHLAAFEAFDNPDKLFFSAQTHWDCYWGLFKANREPKAVLEAFQRHLAPPARIDVVAPEAASVVIAAKDRPQYLEEAIESVLAQPECLHRLIIVNDNSQTPEVDAICRRYAGLERVTYLSSRGRSSSGTARNVGLARVESEYVCFLDDDDYFLPGKLAAQLLRMRQGDGAAFVATASRVVDSAGTLVGTSGIPEYFPGAPLATMLAFCQVVHSSVMLRTEIVRRHGGYLECFKGEDWELWCRLLAGGESMAYLPSAYTVYRRHHSNISNSAYLKEATQNTLSRFLPLPAWKLLSPLPYDPRSGDLIKVALLMLHGAYDQALGYLDYSSLPIARIARFICLRELGEYPRASAELEEWARSLDLLDRVRHRLDIHEQRHRGRKVAVGSAALLLEQRLLARDVLATCKDAGFVPDLRVYYHPNPSYLNIEDGSQDITADIFFSRVALTSC